MMDDVKTSLLMSISFSVFGMLLIFGLGFVFPTINPYTVIKWIIIVAGVAFLISFIKYLIYVVISIKMWRKFWKEAKGKKGAKK